MDPLERIMNTSECCLSQTSLNNFLSATRSLYKPNILSSKIVPNEIMFDFLLIFFKK